MSYCRFSCDNWKSDVYAYESSRGFEVHVAYRKHAVVFEDDFPQLPEDWSSDEYWKAHKKQMEMLEESKAVSSKGEYAGKDFLFSTLEEFLEGMKDIKAKGHNVPSHVFDEIQREIEG